MADLPVKEAGSRLWFLPVMCVLAGIALSLTTIAIDRNWDFTLLPEWLTGGRAVAARVVAHRARR